MPPLDPSTPRVMGIETEYATHPLVGPNNMRLDAVLRQDDESQTSQFGSWGGRIYVDNGKLLEVATPESFSVRGLLAAHFAGERMAARAAAQMHPKAPLYKRTIDSASRTRSDHENYYLTGGDGDPEPTVLLLAAHLATRGVITGPGMLVRQSRRRPDQFRLQPDQRHLDMRKKGRVVAAKTNIPRQKPFATTKADSFDFGQHSHRLEVVSGSQNMMAFPVAARTFVTSALLRLIEHDAYPTELRYRNPYSAMHTTGGPYGLTRRMEAANGKSYTAAEMQLALSEAILQFSDRHTIPPDERAVVEKNYELAQDLVKGDYDHHGRYIEWLAKRQLLDKRLTKRNIAQYDVLSAGLDIKWHSLAENGLMALIRKKGQVALMPSNDDLDQASKFPIDPTRAQKRSAIQRALVTRGERPKKIEWNVIKLHDETSFLYLNDAYDYRYEEPA